MPMIGENQANSTGDIPVRDNSYGIGVWIELGSNDGDDIVTLRSDGASGQDVGQVSEDLHLF